jgi:choline dehydrogenase-like flavoprotein
MHCWWCITVGAVVHPAVVRPTAPLPVARARLALPVASAAKAKEVDVVVIGSGLAGLSCGALLASRGLQVAVLEQHYEIGGCAHAFTVGMDGRTIPSSRLAREPETPVFHFEAGPSLVRWDCTPPPHSAPSTFPHAHTYLHVLKGPFIPPRASV